MWIDTHCHLDAAEFEGQSIRFADQAGQVGVKAIVIPAVHPNNFKAVATLAKQRKGCFYALGIHPIYVATTHESELLALRNDVERVMSFPPELSRFVAIGEIGLDYFVPALTESPLKEKQEYFYIEQLKIARDFGLPVLLHLRKSQDAILKQLRRIKVDAGIAHAFNGSAQQAKAFVDLGFKLGFGGAMTFTRALQIRRLAAELSLHSIVLETDAPDIPPSWLQSGLNSPMELPKIGKILAELRGMSIEEVAEQTSANAQEVLTRLQLPASSSVLASQLDHQY
jgi:TatD DNase family protein